MIPLLFYIFLLAHQLVGAQDGPTIHSIISPKIMIISMWTPEAEIWHANFPQSSLGNLTARMIPLPGLSVLFPVVFCTPDASVCQSTLGEGEINAAASMTALVLAPRLNLTGTYFLLAGVAGVNPRRATIGSVALSRYAVQVALQYEIDARDLPPDWPTGYIPYGRDHPMEYPCVTYGTEVFELNANLRDLAYSLASRANLSDPDPERQRYRSLYLPAPPNGSSNGGSSPYAMAARPPGVVKCDSATSDVYYSGTRLAQAFENTTALWTNGSGVYCMSAQEDNASLEVLVRAAVAGLVDFGRVIAMRAGSNFDRPPPSLSDLQHLTSSPSQTGLDIALANLYAAGIQIVRGILHDWDCTYADGIPAGHYVGDIFGSLGGRPDFGFGSITGGERVRPAEYSDGEKNQGRDGGSGGGGYGVELGLASREMERRRAFGRRAYYKR